MSGLIGVPCGVHGRYSSFWGCLAHLEPLTVRRETVRGSSPAQNRNELAAHALATGAEWVFWLDDDLVFRPDTLTRLLVHLDAGVDVVCGLSVNRRPDFEPIWLDAPEPTREHFYRVPPESIRRDGLVRLGACTSGGMLTSRKALERLTARYGRTLWTLGQCGQPDQWCDDIDFCRKLGALGITIYGDPSVRLGHTTEVELWPHQQTDGSWTTLLVRGDHVITHRPMRAEALTA